VSDGLDAVALSGAATSGDAELAKPRPAANLKSVFGASDLNAFVSFAEKRAKPDWVEPGTGGLP
jgi:hypothetical protein